MALCVMTYNIRSGGEHRENQILNVIQTAKPDVVILQEVYEEEFLEFLSHELGMKHYIGKGNKRRKVALLSKLPVISFKSHHPIFLTWRNFIDANIEYKANQTVRIIGVHPMANLGIVFELWRMVEVTHLIRHIKQYQNEPCVIAGDFNAIAPGESVRTDNMPRWLRRTIYLQGNRVYHFSIQRFISAGFIDTFRLLNSDDGYTLPPPNPNSRLDYIFVNAEMKKYLKNCTVVREPASVTMASDHYPVMAEFSFAE